MNDAFRCESCCSPTFVQSFDRWRNEQRNRKLNWAEEMIDEPGGSERAGVRMNRLDVESKVPIDVRRETVVDHQLLHVQLLHAGHQQHDRQTGNRRPVHQHIDDDERHAVLLDVATDLRLIEKAIHRSKRSRLLWFHNRRIRIIVTVVVRYYSLFFTIILIQKKLDDQSIK